MWLVNVRTLRLEYFTDIRSCPPYVTLSHRWGSTEQELTFPELHAQAESMQAKDGYVKLIEASTAAYKEGWIWLWIDTCCIDKRSSAELQESINSMWAIYENCQVCIAYLSDVAVNMDRETCENRPLASDDNPESIPQQFSASTWFTRGWTLQELLAPQEVCFYSNEWNRFGTRSSLERTIRSITGIPSDCLHSRSTSLSRANKCVATKMSWAAMRQTTRVEDQAYCLMGLFGIQMPLLYGEGMNAFRRLQEEILRNTNDSTIFAFRPSGKSMFLAKSAADFSWWTGIPLGTPRIFQSWAQTNIGLNWTACSTGGPIADNNSLGDEKYFNVLLCDEPLHIRDVRRLLACGMPLYTASRPVRWMSSMRWMLRRKKLVDLEHLELQGQSVVLTLDVLGTLRKSTSAVHYGIGPSLLALPTVFTESAVWKNPERLMLRTIEPGLLQAKKAQIDGK